MTEAPPEHFSAQQLQLIESVAKLNRAADFSEADTWITEPNNRDNSARRVRKVFQNDLSLKLARIHCSRNRSKPINLSDKLKRQRGDKIDGEVVGFGPITAEDAAEFSDAIDARWHGTWEQTRHRIAEKLKAGRAEARAPLPSSDLLKQAAATIVQNRPDLFRLESPEKEQWASRIVRVFWMLTDTSPLDASSIASFRSWAWLGRKPGETDRRFLWRHCLASTFGRALVAHEQLDPHLSLWENLVTGAMMVCKSEPSTERINDRNAARENEATKPTEQNQLFEFAGASKIQRGDREPVKLGKIQLKIMKMLHVRPVIMFKDLFSKQPGSPWRGTYDSRKRKHYQLIHRTISRLNNDKLAEQGMNIDFGSDSIELHVID